MRCQRSQEKEECFPKVLATHLLEREPKGHR